MIYIPKITTSIRGTKEKKNCLVLDFFCLVFIFFFSGSWRTIFCVTFCAGIILDIFFGAESEMTTEGRVSSFTTFTAIPPVYVENIRYTHTHTLGISVTKSSHSLFLMNFLIHTHESYIRHGNKNDGMVEHQSQRHSLMIHITLVGGFSLICQAQAVSVQLLFKSSESP